MWQFHSFLFTSFLVLFYCKRLLTASCHQNSLLTLKSLKERCSDLPLGAHNYDSFPCLTLHNKGKHVSQVVLVHWKMHLPQVTQNTVSQFFFRDFLVMCVESVFGVCMYMLIMHHIVLLMCFYLKHFKICVQITHNRRKECFKSY